MLNNLDQQKRAYCFAIAAVLFWSTVASAFKFSLAYLDTYQLLLVSSLSATFILFLIVLLQGKWNLIAKLSISDYSGLLLFGLLNPFLYYLILFKAYDLLPAQIAQSLNYTWAITLMFLSIPILGHKVTRYDLLATLICYAGVVIICMGGSAIATASLSLTGIILALLSTIIWALYWLYKTRDKIDPVVGLFISFLFSLPFIALAFYLFSERSSWPLNGILAGIYVGLFEMGITFVLWLSAMQLTRSVARISTLIYCSPFLSLFFIYYLLGERIAITTVAGLVMIVTGLLLQRKQHS